jgi:DNA helicase-2/ATP-dependent DNA helicase PcrA
MDSSLEIIKSEIEKRHQGDIKQLAVVFDTNNRLLVEAPAGYGKTNTMVSKIAYMLATNEIPYPKRLLALTFSVNAAYKIKKDVSLKVPELLKDSNLDIKISDKIFVSNYHGFCRRILKKYGYLLHSNLLKIDNMQSIDDSKPTNTMRDVIGLSCEDATFLAKYNSSLKELHHVFIKENIIRYNQIVIDKLIEKEAIPYNAVLTLTIKIFTDYPKILDFYQKIFTSILVDEYQDTNALSYWILNKLITGKTNILLLGDSLQRIYGFIGAIPNLLNISAKKFNLQKIELDKNYRFAQNPSMLLLDKNIRSNAENPKNPQIEEEANIEFEILEDQNEESLYVINKAIKLIREDPEAKVAILVKQRGSNITRIIDTFNLNNVPFFYGLYSDEDPIYTKFHRTCLFEFIELIKINNRVSKNMGKSHQLKIKSLYLENDSPLIEAISNLLSLFWERIFIDFAYVSNEEKIILVKDTFENYGLKQYVEFVNSSIIISTVHGAKGLEWDYVIIPDMEKDSFPNYYGLCNGCSSNSDCILEINDSNESKFLEELSVFYVAITRGRKQVYFSASKKQLDNNGGYRVKNSSCFMNLKGIIRSTKTTI